MRLRPSMPLAILVVMAACSPGVETMRDVVRSKEEAIVVARSAWAGLDLRDRRLRAGAVEGKWVVQREWREGDPTEEAVIIDARTGQAERSSTVVRVMHLNRR